MKKFLQRIRGLDRIIRFSARNRIKDESVSEHCFHVALIGMILSDLERKFGNKVDIEKVLRSALLHDMEECITGDILSDFKHADKKLSKEIEKMSKKFVSLLLKDLPRDLGIFYQKIWENSTNLRSLEGKIVKAADRIEALLYCLEEIEMGNKSFKPVVRKVIKELKSLKLKSVNFVLKELGF